MILNDSDIDMIDIEDNGGRVLEKKVAHPLKYFAGATWSYNTAWSYSNVQDWVARASDP